MYLKYIYVIAIKIKFDKSAVYVCLCFDHHIFGLKLCRLSFNINSITRSKRKKNAIVVFIKNI